MNPAPLLLALAAFAATLAGGLVVVHGRRWFHRITAFAAGVLVAVPLLDLLPEALTLAQQQALAVGRVLDATAAGFVLLLWVDRYLSVRRVCEAGHCHAVHHPHGGLLGAAELVLHSALDGFAIGVGFQASPHVGAVVAAAVIAHDFTDGISTVTVVLKANNSLRVARIMLLADAAAPVIGAVATLFFTLPEAMLALLLALFAGGFLYLGAGRLLPDAHELNPPRPAILLNLAGMALVFVVTTLLRVGA